MELFEKGCYTDLVKCANDLEVLSMIMLWSFIGLGLEACRQNKQKKAR